MIAEPPVFTGGVKVIVALVSPAVAVPIVGAPGNAASTLRFKLAVLRATTFPEMSLVAALTLKLLLVAVVGVPEITPVEELRVSPAGNAGEIEKSVA